MSKTTLASEAYARLKAKIEGGEFTSGEKMTEARVSSILGVGRGPARETLLRLEAEGLIQRGGPHRTRYVEFIESQKIEDLAAQYELREVLDGLAARCAALNMTGRQITVLRTKVERISECIAAEDKNGRVDALADFYQILRSECGNPLVMQACESCRINTYYPLTDEVEQKLIDKMPFTKRPTPLLASVLEAISSHDPDKAESEMRAWTRCIADILIS